MAMKKQLGFILLPIIILVMMLISIILCSMLFLTLSEFESTIKYVDYEKSYYLAIGAKEEVLSILSADWNATIGPLAYKVNDGEYGYELVGGDERRKKIKVYGISNSIQREFEFVVEAPSQKENLTYLNKYALYCHGQLIIEDLGRIVCPEDNRGIIGVTGDVLINKYSKAQEHSIDVKKNVKVKAGNRYFLQYTSFIDSLLPYFQLKNRDDYFKWLQENFSDKVHFINGRDGEITIDKNTFSEMEDSKEVYVLQNVDNFTMKDSTLNGLLILDKVKKISLLDTAQINGTILVFGENTGEIQIKGNTIGNILLCNIKGEAYFNGYLRYDIEEVEKYIPYLTTPLVNNDTKGVVNVIKWNEIREY